MFANKRHETFHASESISDVKNENMRRVMIKIL